MTKSKKIYALLAAITFAAAGLITVSSPAAPAEAHVITCPMTVYEPVILEAGDRDQIVYGFKHSCSDTPEMMYKETQAKIRNTSTGKYVDYGAPIIYQCGYGGRPACRRSYTDFDWTYCVGKNHYKTEGYWEGYHHSWDNWGPAQRPSVGGKWIDCTGHREPYTPEEQATIDAFRGWLTIQGLELPTGSSDPIPITTTNEDGHSVKAGTL